MRSTKCSPDREADTPRMVSSLGYWITWAPMARACWYTAYTPEGLTIASGQLERCLEACVRHHASTQRQRGRGQYPLRLGGRGKRQFRPVNARLYRHRSRTAPALPV